MRDSTLFSCEIASRSELSKFLKIKEESGFKISLDGDNNNISFEYGYDTPGISGFSYFSNRTYYIIITPEKKTFMSDIENK